VVLLAAAHPIVQALSAVHWTIAGAVTLAEIGMAAKSGEATGTAIYEVIGGEDSRSGEPLTSSELAARAADATVGTVSIAVMGASTLVGNARSSSVTGASTGQQVCPSGGSTAANTGVRKVGGRNPINSRYAGETHPSGVRFTKEGFPDFSPYAKAEVEIQGLTGNYAKDAAMANKAVGLNRTPDGYVWHHVEDTLKMQLVPQPIHDAARHTGGASIIRRRGPTQ
jgi:hypothetical protein